MKKTTYHVGILLHDYASPALALMMRDIFGYANMLLKHNTYLVDLIGAKKKIFKFDVVTISTQQPKHKYNYIFVTPTSHGPEALKADWKAEVKLLQTFHQRKTHIAAPCLGVMILAHAGLLNGLEATTHWDCIDYARTHFPQVRWNTQDMLCETGLISTAGGYLATIDLALHHIAQSSGRKLAHELGRVLLAESVREKQSFYATRLISKQDDTSPFYHLENWVDHNLHKSITVSQLATESQMSLRHFQREFTKQYSMGPKSFIQLKRIEKAKQLLRDTRLSLEEIVEKIGLNDLSSFRQLFHREIGMTPAEFRRRIS